MNSLFVIRLVVDALSFFKTKKGEKKRFETLVARLRDVHDVEMKVSLFFFFFFPNISCFEQ